MRNTLAIYFFLLCVTLLERMEAAVYCSSDALFAFPQPWIWFLDQDLMGGARQVYKYKPSSLQFILFPWQIIQRLTTLLLTQIHTHSLIGDASAWLITLFVHPEAARSERGKPLIRQDWDLRLWSSEASHPQSLIPVPWVRSGVSASPSSRYHSEFGWDVLWADTALFCFDRRVALSIFDKFPFLIRLYFLALLSKRLTAFICLFLSINKHVCPPAFSGLINNNYLRRKMQNNNKD